MNDRPRGLGRGLSALLGEPIANAFGSQPAPARVPETEQPVAPAFTPVALTPSSDVVTPFPTLAPHEPAPASDAGQSPSRYLAIELIQRNPAQPRRYFDENELAELADSIRTRGVLQPVVVRPAPSLDGRFELVAGERRWRAAQKAGLTQIPAVVQDLTDVEVLEIGIIENIQRVDLNPLEEATSYQQLIDRFGRTQQEIAEVVGKSRPHIANMLRLLTLPDEVQGMVRDGQLTAGHARAVLAAPNPVQLARMAIEQALNVREVEKLAARAKEEREGPRVRPGGGGATEKDADTRALEATLSNALGLPVALSMRGDGGELKIAFRDLEQLDDLLRRLSA
jgi:ParB family transcriptional regulator, chromosome partitioning protein